MTAPRDAEARERQRFEEWMASSNYPETAELALAKLPDGNYHSQLTFAAWQAWKARADFIERAPVTPSARTEAGDDQRYRFFCNAKEYHTENSAMTGEEIWKFTGEHNPTFDPFDLWLERAIGGDKHIGDSDVVSFENAPQLYTSPRHITGG
jgi:hypothetical protein